ncbi:MAG TPA: single-stranded-DNA-specific exonuclease RecJ [Alphaproteobacteria bacterium]|jgi:single-stranded-DNA-specific exonuclease
MSSPAASGGAGAESLPASAQRAENGETVVARSFTGKRWKQRLSDDRLGLALAQRLGCPEIVGRLLAARGVGPEEAALYLAPTLREQLPDPSHLRDMDKAVERLSQAIRTNESIAIFGDYDVDGATSSALLRRFLRACGHEPLIYIPDRMLEGYGPNGPALLGLADQGAHLVITVDCGIASHEPFQRVKDYNDENKKKGINHALDVIVVDHHLAEPKLPFAHAVINPNRLDETSEHGQMAAVGVTYLLVIAVMRELRQNGYFQRKNLPEPDLLQWLDLVALGTVCDIAKLTGVNRAFVAQGLKVMARRRNPGIAALADVAKLDAKPEAWHCGFFLGPRVNAGGRVGDSDLGVRLLSTDDPAEARELALKLDALNAERRAIEAQVVEQAVATVAEDKPVSVAFAVGQGWHEGVIGIVASRLKDRFDLPAIVLALSDKGVAGQRVAKGSARSVRGVDMGAAVIAARQAGLLLNGGGHAMAAGFAVAEANIPALREFLEERIARELAAGNVEASLSVDGALLPKACTVELAQSLQALGPFGAGNPEPRFWLPAVKLAKVDIVGGSHLRMFVSGDTLGAGAAAGGGGQLKAMAFRVADQELGKALLNAGGRTVALAGRLRANEWMGKWSAEFQIDDAAAVEE